MTNRELCDLLAAGDYAALAKWIGCTRQACYLWPTPVPKRIVQRAVGAYVMNSEDSDYAKGLTIDLVKERM